MTKNVYSFFVTYANVDGFDPDVELVPYAERPVLDRWLLSRLARLVATVESAMDAYDINGAARPLRAFVTDLSQWYVRRSRRRFWKSESDRDKLAAYQTLYVTLTTLSRLLGPFTPFMADALHRNLAGESVHLAEFPKSDPGWVDERLEEQMAAARRFVEQGLAARDAARIKVRQPLRSIALPGDPLPDEATAIVADELNVKRVAFGGADVVLDIEIDDELRLEGAARELVRQVNDLRKKAGLNVEDRIALRWGADGQVAAALRAHSEWIAREVLATSVAEERADGLEEATARIDGEELWIGLRKA